MDTFPPTHPSATFPLFGLSYKDLDSVRWGMGTQSYTEPLLSSKVTRDIGTALLFDSCCSCCCCFFFVLLCSVLLPLHQSLPLFWVSTRRQRPGISWLPVCQCQPWPWPAGWCCRCGNVVPPTGPGSQRLGSLWMQRNSCVCREERRGETQK